MSSVGGAPVSRTVLSSQSRNGGFQRLSQQ
jgi:hypothetical protein